MRTQVLELAEAARLHNCPNGAASPVQTRPATPSQEKPAAPASPSNILDREIVNEPQPLSPAQAARGGPHDPGRGGRACRSSRSTGLLAERHRRRTAIPKGAGSTRSTCSKRGLLALMNARFYQFNLEQVYLAALPVTLQRFAFEPQFYGSLGPVTGVPQNGSGAGGSFPSTPGVAATSGLGYTYATRYGPNGQISALNIGTVAGFGKLFSSGGQLLMGFRERSGVQLPEQEPGTAHGDLGLADQLCAAAVARRRPGGGARAADPGRAQFALRGSYVHALSPAVFRGDSDGRNDSELRQHDSTWPAFRRRATPTRPSASFPSSLTWSKSKSIEGTCFFWKVSLNYIKS